MTDAPTAEEIRAQRLAEFLERFGSPILFALYTLLTVVMIVVGLQHEMTATGRVLIGTLWAAIVFPVALIGTDR